MKKLSRGAYEDTKGFLRVAETLLEVVILTVIYYLVWKQGYEMSAFAYKGKYVLMGVYGLLTYLIFQNADCTMFGQLNRLDLIIGQIIDAGFSDTGMEKYAILEPAADIDSLEQVFILTQFTMG